jgi:hypothetical protein
VDHAGGDAVLAVGPHLPELGAITCARKKPGVGIGDTP